VGLPLAAIAAAGTWRMAWIAVPLTSSLVALCGVVALRRAGPRSLPVAPAMPPSDRDPGVLAWATGEALAFCTLMLEGHPVRFSGQDVERGTFSQRHSVLIDQENEDRYIPFNELGVEQARYEVINSMLSEEAVLGFEYGYSLAEPNALTLWEAQFGDFANGAQVVFDQFVSSGERKWLRLSGLVCLLPHGYEGQGPEHSSARIERFLTLSAEDNIQIVNATTAAQYFHLLRRQVLRDVRKPLIVFTPKKPLRMKESRSRIDELTHGSFEEVLDDPSVMDPDAVKRLVFCSGKVAWDAMAARDGRQMPVAVIRVEQLFPFPQEQLLDLLSRYPNAKELVWLQEEPENMGAWHYMFHNTHPIEDRGYTVRPVARTESGSPATGSATIHEQELADLLDETFVDL